jgi:hypothetical protein
MLSLPDCAALEAALSSPVRPDVQPLLHRRIQRFFDDGLADYTHLLVVEADDSEAKLLDEIGLTPFEHDGIRYGSSDFHPRWDLLHDHGGWFEMTFCIADSGFAYVLLIEDDDRSCLARMCRILCDPLD